MIEQVHLDGPSCASNQYGRDMGSMVGGYPWEGNMDGWMMGMQLSADEMCWYGCAGVICAGFGCACLHGPPSEIPVPQTNMEGIWVVWLVGVLRKMRYVDGKPW